jgi:hypothetical protein
METKPDPKDIIWEEDVVWDTPAAAKAESKEKPTETPEWAGKYPNLYGAAGAARETLGPILEALGVTGGGMAGAAAGGPAGAVGGAALGYSGVKNMLESVDAFLGNQKGKGMVEQAKELPGELATGAVMEAGGQVAGKAMTSAVQGLNKYAPKLYESAMKPSTTLKEAVRDKRVATALKNEIIVSKAGLDKSKEIIADINNTIKTRIGGAAQDMAHSVDLDRALEPVAELSAKTFKKNITPASDMKYISKYMEEVRETRPPFITGQEAQTFKQTLDKELDSFYKALNSGKATPPVIEAQTKAAMANGLRAEITTMFPEVATLNAREGALIELNKSLNQAVNRIRNREIIPLLTGIALGTSPTNSVLKALALKAVEHPEVKSRLAIALYKANSKTAGNAVGTLTRLGALASQQKEQE